jgi:hypothetical protein
VDVGLKAVRKLATAGGMYFSGLLWVYAAARLRHRAVVLMYQRAKSTATMSGSSCTMLGVLRRYRPAYVDARSSNRR